MQNGASNTHKNEPVPPKIPFSLPQKSHYIRTGIAEPAIAGDDTNDSDSSGADSFVSACSYLLDQERDILSFSRTYLHTPDRLVLSATSLRFESSTGKVLPNTDFHKPYTELVEMSQQQTHASILKSLARVTTGLNALPNRWWIPQALQSHRPQNRCK